MSDPLPEKLEKYRAALETYGGDMQDELRKQFALVERAYVTGDNDEVARALAEWKKFATGRAKDIARTPKAADFFPSMKAKTQ